MTSIWYFAEVGILTVCLVLLRGGPPLSWFVTPADRPESSPTPCHMKSVKVCVFFFFGEDMAIKKCTGDVQTDMCSFKCK